MHGQITGQPLRPRAFPLGQQAESPLYRSENREHSEQDLLAVNRSPPTDSEHHEGNQHDDFVYSHHHAGRQRGKPQLCRVLLHVRHLVHARLLHRRLYQVGVGRARVGDIGTCL